MTDPQANPTPPYLQLMRHTGACGPRRHCWRTECRERWDPLATLEVLPDQVLAHCHRAAYAPDDFLVRGFAA